MNIDHADSPELQNYFTSKEAGEECELTIKGRIVSTQPGMTEIDIEEVELDYAESDEPVMPDEEEPLGIEIIELSDMEEASEEMGMEPGTDEVLDLDDDTD